MAESISSSSATPVAATAAALKSRAPKAKGGIASPQGQNAHQKKNTEFDSPLVAAAQALAGSTQSAANVSIQAQPQSSSQPQSSAYQAQLKGQLQPKVADPAQALLRHHKTPAEIDSQFKQQANLPEQKASALNVLTQSKGGGGNIPLDISNEAAVQLKSGVHTGASQQPLLAAIEPMPERTLAAEGFQSVQSIAGPDPWSREWVFGTKPGTGVEKQLTSGGEGQNNQHQPLTPLQNEGLLSPQIAPAPKKDRVSLNNLSGSDFVNTLQSTRGAGLPAPETNLTGVTPTQSQLAAKTLPVIEHAGEKKSDGSQKQSPSAPNPLVMSGSEVLGSLSNARLPGPSPIRMEAQVIKGSMARDRLSSESLTQLSQGVQTLLPSGGGEMRLRLNPDHLGEVSLKVTTRGNHVSLQVKTQDEAARSVIEDSLGYLKDTLAAKDLHLGKVDLSIIEPKAQSTGMLDSTGNSSLSFQNSTGDMSASSDGRSEARRQRDDAASERQNSPRSRMPESGLSSSVGSMRPAKQALAANGRVDLWA